MNDALLCKRIFDVNATLLFFSVFWPFFLIIYVLVYMTSGKPVFFIQERLGQKGIVFGIIKFRTMIVNAVKTGKGIFVEENDMRITRVGNILRKTSMDELPQLINVLKGDMSIVGPRPPLPDYPKTYEEYTSAVKQRFEFKPGITGYAQISGRKNLDWDERFGFDTIYVNSYSFWMDMYILIKSVIAIISKEGVYGDQ